MTEKIGKPAEKVSAMVLVEKDGGVRFCIDQSIITKLSCALNTPFQTLKMQVWT